MPPQRNVDRHCAEGFLQKKQQNKIETIRSEKAEQAAIEEIAQAELDVPISIIESKRNRHRAG
jgi:exonuclease I